VAKVREPAVTQHQPQPSTITPIIKQVQNKQLDSTFKILSYKEAELYSMLHTLQVPA